MSEAIPSWARVGAKVVCVNDASGQFQSAEIAHLGLDGLRCGEIYTIRAVGYSKHWGTPGIWLEEIVRPIKSSRALEEEAFHILRFRPVKTIEDDIATHFAALLDVREPVGA